MLGFIYTELAHAEEDLKIFSTMNAYEDRLLFLYTVPEGAKIGACGAANARPIEGFPETIISLALNGMVFDAKM